MTAKGRPLVSPGTISSPMSSANFEGAPPHTTTVPSAKAVSPGCLRGVTSVIVAVCAVPPAAMSAVFWMRVPWASAAP